MDGCYRQWIDEIMVLEACEKEEANFGSHKRTAGHAGLAASNILPYKNVDAVTSTTRTFSHRDLQTCAL